MNTKRMAALADFIEKHELQIDMRNYIALSPYNTIQFVETNSHNCGTAACLAGWGLFYMKEQGEELGREFADIDTIVRRYLGLTQDQADALFFPRNGFKTPRRIDRARALKVLRGEIPLTQNWLLS